MHRLRLVSAACARFARLAGVVVAALYEPACHTFGIPHVEGAGQMVGGMLTSVTDAPGAFLPRRTGLRHRTHQHA